MLNYESFQKKLTYTTYFHREMDFRHHTYDEEMLQYEYLKEGNLKAVEESLKFFGGKNVGHLSDNPLRNYKYMFVAATTLATRFAIEGGLDAETAYNTSDLYIQKMDLCLSTDSIRELNLDMMTTFTRYVAESKKRTVYSKPIVLCMDYIYNHLHEMIKVSTLAKLVSLNEKYLSTLFKKEIGTTITEYIVTKRMEAASNMLKFSDYSYSEISSVLAFSSQSYFTCVFKKHTGLTPKQYRQKYFRMSFS